MAAVGLSMVLCGGAWAGEKDRADDRRGYVDGSVFAELVDDDANLVEVSIGPALLKPLARGIAKSDEHLARLLSELHSIQAVVAEVDGDDADKADDLVSEMTKRLSRDGWQRIARVREKNEQVNVLAIIDDGAIAGLTVMVLDKGGSKAELVFVNIAGRIDLELMGEMGMKVGIPGLEALGEIDWAKIQAAGADGHDAKKDRERGSH